MNFLFYFLNLISKSRGFRFYSHVRREKRNKCVFFVARFPILFFFLHVKLRPFSDGKQRSIISWFMYVNIFMADFMSHLLSF